MPWQLSRQPSNCLVTDALTHYSTNTFKQPTKVYKLMVAQLLRLFIKVLQNLNQGKTILFGGKLCRSDYQTYLFELFLSCGELTSLHYIVTIEPKEAWRKFFLRLENWLECRRVFVGKTSGTTPTFLCVCKWSESVRGRQLLLEENKFKQHHRP